LVFHRWSLTTLLVKNKLNLNYAKTAMKTNERITGIDVIGKVPWGTHLCQFYQTKEDLIDILVPYFKVGLNSNELCVWLTSEPLTVERARASLTGAVRKLNDYIKKGQIEIVNASEWYAKSGKFNSEEVLRRWIEKEKLALQKGFDGLRLSGNTSRLQREVWEQFADYEQAMDRVIGEHRMIAICSYCMDKCIPSNLIVLVNNHGFTLSGQKGNWKVTQSARLRRVEHGLQQSKERYRVLAENVSDVIWTADVNAPNRLNYVSTSITSLLGYSVEEAMAKSMEEVFEPSSVEAAMKALTEELDMENMERKDMSRSRTLELEMKHKDGSIVPVEVKYSYLRGSDGRPAEIVAVARDVSKRKEAELEIKQSTQRLIGAMEDTIQAMAMIVEMRDPYTAGHQRRVAQLACAIAQEIGLSPDQINGLRLAGTIHDIGKVRVPAEILTNPDGLSDAEYSIIKMHPVLGHEILKTINLPWPIAEIIHQHHERMDGSGYPLGLSGKDIIIEARILAVADVVEAITSHRPYRPAHGIDKALEEISQNRGKLYDPEVVDACLKLFSQQKFSFNQVTKAT
jgi:PAS domain S-box-containing protein/putative nucleotidyltransferase with HDIG domain